MAISFQSIKKPSRRVRSVGSSSAPRAALAGAQDGVVGAVSAGLSALGDDLLQYGYEGRRQRILDAATRDGTAAGADQMAAGQGLTLRDGETEADLAFNNAAVGSYMARSDAAFSEKVDQIFAENGDDPQAFANRFDEAGTAYLENLPENLRPLAQIDLDVTRTRLVGDVQSRARLKAEDNANATLLGQQQDYVARFENAMRNGDALAAEQFATKYMAALEARSDLDAGKKAMAVVALEHAGQRQAALGEFESVLTGQGFDAGQAFIDAFSASDKVVDPDTRDDIAAEMTAIWRRQKAVADHDAAEARAAADMDNRTARANVDIQISLAKSKQEIEAAHNALEALRQDGTFDGNPEKYASLVIKLDKRADDVRTSIDGIRHIAAIVAGDEPPDPGNLDTRKAADTYWKDQLVPQLSSATPAQKAAAKSALVRSLAYVPQGLQDEWESVFAAGTPEQKAAAADEITRSMETPNGRAAIDRLPSDLSLWAIQVDNLVGAGVDPIAAVERVEERMRPDNQLALEHAEGRLKELRTKYEDWVEGHFDDFLPWYSLSDVAIPEHLNVRAQVLADFKTLFEGNFLVARDASAAKDAALATLGRVWGVTRIEGEPRAMKYPPENYYPISADEIRRQLHEDTQAILPGAGGLLDDEMSIMLIPDAKTRRGAESGAPTWRIVIRNEQGLYLPLLDEDREPLRWAPRMGTEK